MMLMSRSQNYLTIFLYSRAILRREALVKGRISQTQRYFRNLYAVTATDLFSALDQTLKRNNLKKFLKEASKIEVLELLLQLTLILIQTLLTNQFEMSENIEKKRVLLRAVLSQHLRYICRQKPSCAQPLDALLSVLVGKEELDGELLRVLIRFCRSLLRVSELM